MKNPTDIVSGCFLLGLCAIGAWSVSSIPSSTGLDHFGPSAFPKLIIVLLTVLSFILLIQGFIKKPLKFSWPDRWVLKRILIFVGLFYLYLIILVGLDRLFLHMDNPPFQSGGAFGISTTLFLLLALPLLGRRRPMEIILVSFITTAVLIGTFGWFFKVLLP